MALRSSFVFTLKIHLHNIALTVEFQGYGVNLKVTVAKQRQCAGLCSPRTQFDLQPRDINAFEHRLTIYVLKLAFIISLCLRIAFCNT